MTYYVAGIPYSNNELYHFGIKGQKWGIRRYQNDDGSLTPAGKARYGTPLEKMAAKDAQRYSDASATYGVGSRTRVKLLDKELNEKKKNKEYAKAYNEASKHVNVAKSLKRANRLNKHQGLFARGKELSESGRSTSTVLMKTLGSIATTALLTGAIYAPTTKSGASSVSKIMLIAGGISAAGIAAKGARDVAASEYYKKNKKF